MTTRIKLRRDTAANWTDINPVLALAEPGVETDTNKMKVGDGTKTWTQLTYLDGADVTRLAVGFANSLRVPDIATGEGSSAWFNSVVSDNDLNSYYVGAFYDDVDTNNDMALMAKYDVDGNLLWQKKLSTVDGFVSEGESIAIDPTTDDLVIISSLWTTVPGASDPGSILYRLNPLTGALIGTPLRIRDDSIGPQSNYPSVYPYDIAMDGAAAVVVGYISTDFFQAVAPKQTGSALTKIKIQRSILETGAYPSAYNGWYVNGTGITGNATVTNVNDYNAISSGTSTNGSGAEFDFSFYISHGTTYRTVQLTGTTGSAYQVNDVITVAAAVIGATVDAHITVTGIGAGGAVTTYTCTDYTPDTNYILLTVDSGSVNFSNSGTWNVAQDRGNNGYVYSQQGSGWQKTVGNSDADKFVAVAIDSSSNVYAAGKTFDNVYDWDRSMLVKFNSAGVLQYAKTFDFAGTEGMDDGYSGIAIDSNDNVYLAGAIYDWDNTNNNFFTITKVNSSGTMVWQKALENNGPFDLWNMCLAVDSDDNLYLAAETDSATSQNDDYYFAKFNPSGVVQWQRSIQNWADVDSQWNNGLRSLSVKGDKFFYAGSTMAFSVDYNYGSFAFSAPTDGSGLGPFNNGMFTYVEIDYGDWNDTPTQQTVTLDVSVANATLTTDNPSTGVTNSEFIIKNATMYTGPGGEVGVAKQITFEDGSVQTTAAFPGYPPSVDSPLHGNGGLYLRLDHAGKTIRYTGASGNTTIYVPTNSDVPFEVGTVITIIYDQFNSTTNSLEVRADDWNTTKVVGVGFAADNPADWWNLNNNDHTLVGVYRLTKIDTDRWVLEGQDLQENWC